MPALTFAARQYFSCSTSPSGRRGVGAGELEEDEEDPWALLIRRLQEYERFKKVAEEIEEMPRMERDTWLGSANPPDLNCARTDPEVDMRELLLALGEVLRRADMFESHHIQREGLSTRERMSQILERLAGQHFVPFVALFSAREGRRGVVAMPGRWWLMSGYW